MTLVNSLRMPWSKPKPRPRSSLPLRLLIVGGQALLECEDEITDAQATFIREWWELAAGGSGRTINVTAHPKPPRSPRPMLPDPGRRVRIG